MSAVATASVDQVSAPAVPVSPSAAAPVAEDTKKESVSLEELWRHSVEFAKRLGQAGGNFLAFILRMIRAVVNRVCTLCGAEYRMSGDKPEDGQELSQAAAPTLELTGPGAADAATVIKGIADLNVENFLALAPAMERLEAKDGGDYLKAAMDSLIARQEDLKKSHTELLQANEPLMRAVCEGLNVDSYEEAFDALSEGLLSGPPIDPNGEYRALYVKMTHIENEIKRVNSAMRAYLDAALDLDELRPQAVEFLKSERFVDIRKTLENTQNPSKTEDKSIARGIESRNNLGDGRNVVDLSVARARELPASLSPGVPVSETAPLGMSRFAGVNKLKVGDMSGQDEEHDAAQPSTRELPKA